jgi:hypothetical protein
MAVPSIDRATVPNLTQARIHHGLANVKRLPRSPPHTSHSVASRSRSFLTPRRAKGFTLNPFLTPTPKKSPPKFWQPLGIPLKGDIYIKNFWNVFNLIGKPRLVLIR